MIAGEIDLDELLGALVEEAYDTANDLYTEAGDLRSQADALDSQAGTLERKAKEFKQVIDKLEDGDRERIAATIATIKPKQTSEMRSLVEQARGLPWDSPMLEGINRAYQCAAREPFVAAVREQLTHLIWR